ncbi:zinc-binding dehydrogenase [Amycolatopsis ultiminotia]
MRALVVARDAPGSLQWTEVPRPVPAPDEVLVRADAVAVNHGELAFGVGYAPEGAVLGYDAAGVVETPAADGTGPAAGTPVLTVGSVGGWAEYRAVPVDSVGVAPDAADPGVLAAVCTAGATALRAVRKLGSVVGRRVLVTGATGGVGRFAVQLARRAGAHVIAVVPDPSVAPGPAADEVVRAPGELDAPVAGVIDLVGGGFLATSFAKLTSGGILVSVGHAAGAVADFDYLAMFADPAALGRHDRSIVTLYLPAETGIGADLTWLAAEVVAERLDPGIAWRGDWQHFHHAADLLLNRKLHGRAVLTMR